MDVEPTRRAGYDFFFKFSTRSEAIDDPHGIVLSFLFMPKSTFFQLFVYDTASREKANAFEHMGATSRL